MAQQKGSMIENTFGQGLVTEATGLNFPKDAVSDTLNCVFERDTSVSRRKGFDIDGSSNPTAADMSNAAVVEHQWRNVAGVSNLTFTVIQMGNVISIFSNNNVNNISDNILFQVSLDSRRVANAPLTGNIRCQITEGLGRLFVVHPYCEPFFVKYNQGDGSFSTVEIDIAIRDIQGTADGLGITQNPLTLSMAHKYNLYNQGWAAAPPCGYDTKVRGVNQFIIQYWHDTIHNFPSNADYWWISRDALDQFNPQLVGSKSLGASLAPRGHFVTSAFFIDRGYLLQATDAAIGYNQDQYPTEGNYSDIPVESSGFFRPSVVAFYSGRCFYAGVNFNSPNVNYSNKIYFSRIIETDSHIGQCYQDGDPSAEEGNDLLPSDGGVIDSPEIGTIYKLFPIGYSLIIFASNGIWSISGNTGTGFTAKDYSIAKISSKGIASETSLVDKDGTPIWWSLTGINTLAGSQSPDSGTSTGTSLVSLSEDTIKSLFLDIPDINKNVAKGFYNQRENTVYWLYRSTPSNSTEEAYTFDRVLTLNTTTKAFSLWSCPSSFKIKGATVIKNPLVADTTKYITDVTGNHYSFSQVRREDYTDFGVEDNTSFFDTGYAVDGQGVAKFCIPYIFIYMDGNVGGSLRFFHKWNYANSSDTGKFSSHQTVYTSKNYDYETVRKKVRGSGRAVVLHFESISGQPFSVTGWAMTVSINGGP